MGRCLPALSISMRKQHMCDLSKAWKGYTLNWRSPHIKTYARTHIHTHTRKHTRKLPNTRAYNRHSPTHTCNHNNMLSHKYLCLSMHRKLSKLILKSILDLLLRQPLGVKNHLFPFWLIMKPQDSSTNEVRSSWRSRGVDSLWGGTLHPPFV